LTDVTMRKPRSAGIVLLLLCSAALVGVLAIRSRYDFPALEQTDPQAFNYSMRTKKVRDFVMRFRLERDGPETPSSARVVYDWMDDQNHDFLHLTEAQLWLGRTEAGLERRVGSAPQPYDSAGELTLRRWQGTTSVFVDGRFVAEAATEATSARKAVGWGATDSSVGFSGSRPQPLERIRFADDFMSAEQNAVSWQTPSGNWRIRTIKNSLRSANAFRFDGCAAGEPAIATAGYAFWHDYRFDAACRPSGAGAIGLIFYRNGRGYYRFEWSAGASGRRRLVRVADDTAAVLMDREGGYVVDQWYKLSVEITRRRIRCFIDGHLVGEVEDDRLVGGGIGLWVDGEQECAFDDVEVQSVVSLRDGLHDPLLTDWQQLEGDWEVVDSGWLVGVADTAATSLAKVVTKEDSWGSCELSAVSRIPSGAAAGLCFCYRDEVNYYRLEVVRDTSPRLALVKVAEGRTSVLAEMPLPADVNSADGVRLRVFVAQNVVRAYVDGREILPATWDIGLSTGRVGLCVRDGTAAFSEFAVNPLGVFDRSVVGAQRTFSHEKSMANWASAEGEWLAAQGEDADGGGTTFWHRADVPGDGGISVRLPVLDRSSDGPRRVALLLGADTADSTAGCMALLGSTPDSSNSRLELSFGGRILKARDCPEAWNARILRLQRVGHVVSVWLDGVPELVVHEPEMTIAGLRAGWRAQGVQIEHEHVSVFSRNVYLDDFRKAPVNWRTPAGQWDVTVRWECDPRWSFFSGRGGIFAGNDEKLAALWYKPGLPGDFTVEFTVGQKMAREFGSYADYTRDFNVTICADGRDLISGYTCTLGGWHNTKTAILRGHDVVAETEEVLIPRSNSMHRQWFNVKVRKQASIVSFLLDDTLVLEYDDPDPLPGSRVAVWTYNNGVMISRFRVSAEEVGPAEAPGITRGTACRSFYDLPLESRDNDL
jgi:hypothetical protein